MSKGSQQSTYHVKFINFIFIFHLLLYYKESLFIEFTRFHKLHVRRKNSKIKQVQILLYFEIIEEIEDVETIAVGGRIGDIMRLCRQYGL